MKVLHLITGLQTGGAEKMLLRLVSEMDRSRFENVVVSMTDQGTIGKALIEGGIPLETLQFPPGKPSIKGFVKFINILKKEKPDILQTWLYHSDLLGVIAGKISGRPAIIWNVRCSNMEMGNYSKLSSLVVSVLARLSRLPRAVIVNSQAGRRYHQTLNFKPKKWVFIPNGVDLDLYLPSMEKRSWLRKELGVEEKTFLIGHVSRYDPMKDQKTFLQAANIFSHKFSEAHFIMAGRGLTPENEKLIKIINQLKLRSRIHLLGEREDVPSLMAGMDIFALSSAFGEGFPNVIVEAMACGIPCVATDVGDSALILGKTGRVIPPGDPDSLARVWEELYRMGPSGRSEMGLDARRQVRENFSISAVVRQYQDFYSEIFKEGKAAH